MKRLPADEFGRLDMRAYAHLPGFELTSAGLLDLAAGRESIEALLLRSASIRLSAVGIPLTDGAPADTTTRLYEMVAAQVGEGRAHGRYNALRRRLASFLRAAQAVHARPVDRARLRDFLAALGRVAAEPATAYLVGGASAVVEGWRPTTIAIDLYLEPERDELLRAIPGLKEQLELNLEFASPLDFLPELPGWRDRSRFVSQEGALTIRGFDFYAQALAKLERGFDADQADVRAMIDRGLVSVPELERLFDAISGALYRFQAVDAVALRSAIARLGPMVAASK